MEGIGVSIYQLIPMSRAKIKTLVYFNSSFLYIQK
jgi:hypothetical protein